MKPIDMLGMGPERRVMETPEGNFLVIVIPPAWADSGDGKSILLSPDQFRRYNLWRTGGELIQNCLPELTRAQREILISGT